MTEDSQNEARGQWQKPMTHSYESRQEFVQQLAYQYWEKRGRPLGSPQVDWFAAEKDLRSYLLNSGVALGEGGNLYR